MGVAGVLANLCNCAGDVWVRLSTGRPVSLDAQPGWEGGWGAARRREKELRGGQAWAAGDGKSGEQGRGVLGGKAYFVGDRVRAGRGVRGWTGCGRREGRPVRAGRGVDGVARGRTEGGAAAVRGPLAGRPRVPAQPPPASGAAHPGTRGGGGGGAGTLGGPPPPPSWPERAESPRRPESGLRAPRGRPASGPVRGGLCDPRRVAENARPCHCSQGSSSPEAAGLCRFPVPTPLPGSAQGPRAGRGRR